MLQAMLPFRFHRRNLIGAVLFICGTLSASAQYAVRPPARPVTPPVNFGNTMGLGINLHNSGFGINGFISKSINPNLAFTAEISLRSEKDEKEEKFFDWWGNSIIPGKLNYLMLIPAQVGIQKRLFADDIDDNFRPYVQASAGPTLAWLSPYFDDDNQDGEWQSSERLYDSIASIPHGKAYFAVAGGAAMGAQFGKSRRSLQAFRVGVDMTYVPKEVKLMETSTGQHLFLTPSISIIFGRFR